MRTLPVPQAEILGDVLVLIDARLNLHGAVHQLLFRELEINQVPQSISVAAGSHPPDQIVLAPRGERQDQQELGFFLPRQGGHYISGLHGRRSGGISEAGRNSFGNTFSKTWMMGSPGSNTYRDIFPV